MILVFVLSHWAEETSSALTWRGREVEEWMGDLKIHKWMCTVIQMSVLRLLGRGGRCKYEIGGIAMAS